MSKPILIDTSVLISFYNRGSFAEQFFAVIRSGKTFYSAVTINEFVRGAHDAVSKEAVAGFLEIVKCNLVNPTLQQWIECGTISEKILKNGKRSKSNILLLQNDILIALSAKDMDALLITADKKDFQLIQSYMDLSIEYW